MEQYIPKSAIVAEIERIRRIEVTNNDVAYNGALDEIRYILDTLEVKEVDFEKEIEQSFIDLDYHLDAYNRVEDYVGENIDMVEYKRIAKHFFELGLRVSNPLTWEDIEEIDDLLDELLPSKFDDVLELKGAYEEVLKRFKAQKGE